MIGFISGILRDKDYDNITVECGGVGFHIMVTNSCMSAMPQVDEEVVEVPKKEIPPFVKKLFGKK